MTVTFLVILLFKVSLTSGAIYSFVFFAQITSLSINELQVVYNHNYTQRYTLYFFECIQYIQLDNGQWTLLSTILHCANQKHHDSVYVQLLDSALRFLPCTGHHLSPQATLMLQLCEAVQTMWQEKYQRIYSGWSVCIPSAVLLPMCCNHITNTSTLKLVWYWKNSGFIQC